MTQAVTGINSQHILALEIFLSAEKIPKAPMRRDLQAYYEELILNHLEPLVRGRLVQKRENAINFARQHDSLHRLHSAQKPITDQKVRRIAFEEMLVGLTSIKLWLLQHPEENFVNREGLIQAAVNEFEKFREK